MNKNIIIIGSLLVGGFLLLNNIPETKQEQSSGSRTMTTESVFLPGVAGKQATETGISSPNVYNINLEAPNFDGGIMSEPSPSETLALDPVQRTSRVTSAKVGAGTSDPLSPDRFLTTESGRISDEYQKVSFDDVSQIPQPNFMDFIKSRGLN